MIFNRSRNIVLTEKHKILRNPFSQAIGMMFKNKKNVDYALIFEFKSKINFSITNIFVFFSIDLLFLNSSRHVVDIKKNFRPFSFCYKPKKNYKYLIETIAHNKEVRIGDILEW